MLGDGSSDAAIARRSQGSSSSQRPSSRPTSAEAGRQVARRQRRAVPSKPGRGCSPTSSWKRSPPGEPGRASAVGGSPRSIPGRPQASWCHRATRSALSEAPARPDAPRTSDPDDLRRLVEAFTWEATRRRWSSAWPPSGSVHRDSVLLLQNGGPPLPSGEVLPDSDIPVERQRRHCRRAQQHPLAGASFAQLPAAGLLLVRRQPHLQNVEREPRVRDYSRVTGWQRTTVTPRAVRHWGS